MQTSQQLSSNKTQCIEKFYSCANILCHLLQDTCFRKLQSIYSENAEFRFQQKTLDNITDLRARVLLEAIIGVPVKILLIVGNLDKATHTLG